MKIALISPAGAMHRYNGSFHKGLHYAPITLALLAALVPPELNAGIAVYDETAGPIPLDTDADVIAVTCITGTAARCYRYADYFRSKGKTVLLGGVHPTLCPDEAALHADAVLTGLGEQTFPQALRDIRAGCLKKRYDGGGCPDIARRPLPRKDLLDKKKYVTLNTVEAVRGCNHSCTFCAYPAAFGRRVITRPVRDVIDEIKSFKGKEVIFPDVNLIADAAYAKELFTALAPLKKWWFGLTTTAIGHNDELLEIFRKSGCKGLLIGFESVNQDTQKEIGKGVNHVAEYKALMNKLHKKGIMVMGCFAFGADCDGPDVFDRTVDLCVKARIDLPRFSIITPFPGTEFYNELEKEGRIVERDWSMYDVEHCVYRPKNMTKEELENGVARAWKKAYSIGNILRRLDLTKFRTVKSVYMLVNIGYRKYAKAFRIFGKEIMSDNSDVPEPHGER
ncbi:MAG: B12-binding domain-containing radical SAM protein [Clostridia bacterium]|nr:B12-binding domain-containing radical SAM protein [Clostridia bacterium]